MYLLEQNPEAARDRDTINVIVGECFDGWLSDARALAVRPEHAREAIAGATPDDTREGAVGAGTGTTTFGYKAGIGGASRLTDGGILGCLVNPNYGARRDLHMLVGPSAAAQAHPRHRAAAQGGSVMVVRPGRAAVRAPAGPAGGARDFRLGRAGSFSSNEREYVVAFSTAHRIPHRSQSLSRICACCATIRRAAPALRGAGGSSTRRFSTRCAGWADVGRDGNRVVPFRTSCWSRARRDPGLTTRAPQREPFAFLRGTPRPTRPLTSLFVGVPSFRGHAKSPSCPQNA